MLVLWKSVGVLLLGSVSVTLADCDLKINRNAEWKVTDVNLNYATRHSFSTLYDDSIWIMGGMGDDGPTHRIEKLKIRANGKLDPNEDFELLDEELPSDQFTEPWVATGSGAVTIDNAIYLACEDSADGSVWKLDPETFSFEVIATMPTLAEDCCLAADANRKQLYIIGGQSGGVGPDYRIPDLQIYNIDDDTWETGVTDMNVPRANLGCTAMKSGQNVYILAVGGRIADDLDSIERYSVNDNEWELFEGVLDPPRRLSTVNVITDTDYIAIIGGHTRDESGKGDSLDNVDIFNVKKGELDIDCSEAFPGLNAIRAGHRTVVTNNGNRVNLYVYGGKYIESEEHLSSLEAIAIQTK